MLCWTCWKNAFYKFHPCSQQNYTKSVFIDIATPPAGKNVMKNHIRLWPMHYRTPPKECNNYATYRYPIQKNPQKQRTTAKCEVSWADSIVHDVKGWIGWFDGNKLVVFSGLSKINQPLIFHFGTNGAIGFETWNYTECVVRYRNIPFAKFELRAKSHLASMSMWSNALFAAKIQARQRLNRVSKLILGELAISLGIAAQVES